MTQANTKISIPLSGFYKHALPGLEVIISKGLWIPDVWTKVFAEGLQRVAKSDPNFSSKTVLEVGVGSGINMAGLQTGDIPAAKYIGTDYVQLAVDTARALAKKLSMPASNVEFYQSDLLLDVEAERHSLEDVGHIVACIPQIPSTPDFSHEGDTITKPSQDDGEDYSRWEKYGLDLNARLLKQAGESAPEAQVTLNLAGRPTLGILQEMFKHFNYEASAIYSEIVPQDPGTSLASLAKIERDTKFSDEPVEFEFFADPHGEHKINAREAHDAMLGGKKVYHSLHVMTAKLSESFNGPSNGPIGPLGALTSYRPIVDYTLVR